MKKLLFIVSVFVLLGSSSCKKDWTCTCTYNGGTGVNGQPINATVTYPINNSTKAQATTACNNDGTALNASVGSSSCSI